MRRAHGESGQALVEFALVAMVFFMIVFGIIDFSRLFQAWVTVQHAAREGARYGVTGQVQCDPYTDNRTECIKYVAKEATTGLSGAPDNVNVTLNSWEYPDYTTEHAGSPGEQCDAEEVVVDYDFEFAAPIISNVLGFVQIPIQGRERLVNEPYGPCATD
jgi:Flp pilus assembly protein TadG